MKTPRYTMQSFSLPLLAGIAIGVLLTNGAGASLLGSGIFPDVESGSFYDEAVGEMYGVGVIKGYADGKFGPNDPVTRGQLAVMLKRLRDDITGGSSYTTQSSSRRSSSSSSSGVDSEANTTVGSFHFTSDTFYIPDTASTVTVSVIRSGGKQGSTVVTYQTVDGTGVAGTDYTGTNGTLSYGNNETSKNITVHLVRNSAATTNRAFTIVLKDPTNGATLITPATATVTLLKAGATVSSSSAAAAVSSAPGGLFAFSAAGFGALENASTATVTVTRTGNTSASATVDFATSDGTAFNGVNYSQNSGTLTFAANETSKTFTVSLIDNSAVEGNKTINLSLKNPTSSAALGVPSVATLTLIDDESAVSGSGVIKFTSSSYTVKRSAGAAYIAVTRAGGTTGTASVYYETFDDTASNGVDYTRVTGTLTFNPGEMQKVFMIPLLSSSSAGDLEVNLRLSGVTGNSTQGNLTDASLTITD